MESERRWRQTARFAFDLVLNCDESGEIKHVDTHRDDIDADRMVGKSIYQLVDPDFGRPLRDAFTRTLEQPGLPGGQVHTEVQALGPKDEFVWYDFRICAYVDQGEIVVAVYATVIDEHKKSLKKIGVLNAELELARRMNIVGKFATNLAHEMRQPLQVIMSYASAMLMHTHDQDDPLLEDSLQEIEISAKNADHAIQELRESVAKRVVRPEIVEVSELLRTVLTHVEPLRAEHNALVEPRVTPGVQGLYANHSHVVQVLTNLVRNGIEAAAEMVMADRIRVAIDVQQQDNDFTEFIVSDNGPGVPVSQRGKIFNRHVSTKPTGMGVGLALSRDIVEEYGGKLTLEPRSADKRGAVFKFYLPCRPPKENASE